MSLKGNATSLSKLRGKINDCDILLLSAYGIAVKNGFQGTEEEWLASLDGKDGATGQRGSVIFPLNVNINTMNGTIQDADKLIEGGIYTVYDLPVNGDMFCTNNGYLCYINGVKGKSGGGYDFEYRMLANIKGPSGKTPVKGEDYFTEAEKAEMVEEVLSAIPMAEGGSF